MHGSRLFQATSTLLLTLFAAIALASEKVTISTGEVVILSDDGTWNYEKRPVQRNKVIKTDRSGFKETDNCDYYGNRNTGDFNLWIDPSRMRHGAPQIRPPKRPVN